MAERATITLLGAAGEVTGSCTLLDTPRGRVVIDFGLFQGSPEQEQKNLQVPEIDWRHVDAVIVTHAHIDHVGRLGMLPRIGCGAPIYATPPTADLLPRVLRSSATLQTIRHEEWRNGSAPIARVVDPPPAPGTQSKASDSEPPILYDTRDAMQAAENIRPVEYGVWREVKSGLRFRFHDASHIIGSASVEVAFDVNGREKKVLFSGDLGPARSPLLRAREELPAVDLMLMESTNGARVFSPSSSSVDALGAVVKRVAARGGKILAPTFSLGRAQTLLLRLAELSRANQLHGMTVYLDSPMAIRASELCGRYPALLEPSLRIAAEAGTDPLHFDGLQHLFNRKQSLKLTKSEKIGVILAGSGFCDAGPVLHHLASMVDDPKNALVFAGHQIVGLLGHSLLHHAKKIELKEGIFDVLAERVHLEGLSGHADQADLVNWIGSREGGTPRVILNHGENESRAALSDAIRAALALETEQPNFMKCIEV
ncbi:MAG: MBL fold metallo-hydrolase [Planctomycetes bacterium]|nr:MBL fold metallo-hydrolase [Planctomycetota bacterium]